VGSAATHRGVGSAAASQVADGQPGGSSSAKRPWRT
jgi:hypothetical protein